MWTSSQPTELTELLSITKIQAHIFELQTDGVQGTVVKFEFQNFDKL
jgi:hypothetical protein